MDGGRVCRCDSHFSVFGLHLAHVYWNYCSCSAVSLIIEIGVSFAGQQLHLLGGMCRDYDPYFPALKSFGAPRLINISVRCINGSPSTPCLLLNRRPKARRPESGDAGTTCVFAALGRIWIGWQDIRCASWAILPSVE
jgi:hypothetical protein